MTEPMELAFEERGSGPVLLFVHGFPFDRTMWIPQLAGLAKIRTCIAVDLRGHGLSTDETPKDYSMDIFADDIARTLDAMGTDQVDLCGMSMGGYVAFAFYRLHPSRVRSLILCNTKAEADSPEGKAGREKTAELATSQGMEPLWGQLEGKIFGENPPAQALEKARSMILAVDPSVAAADALAMRDRRDVAGDLGSISVPVLWVHGEQDKLMPVDAARATAETIPGARFVPLAGGGHCAVMEVPDACNDAIREFLKG